jgi:hypothetical protein
LSSDRPPQQAKETVITEDGVDYVIFDFEKAGDFWPQHVHTENGSRNHATVVARGSVKDSVSGQIFNTGNLVFWPVEEPHGFVALVDNTRLVNIRVAVP